MLTFGERLRRIVARDRLKKAISRKVPSRPAYPHTIEREYERELLNIVNLWASIIEKQVLPRLESFTSEAYRFRQDAWQDDFAEVMTQLEIQVRQSRTSWEILARDIGQKTSDWNDTQWRKTMRSVLSIDLYQREPYLADMLRTFSHENVQLIKKLAEETQGDIHRIVSQGILEDKRHETISREIMKGTDLQTGRFRKTRTRAKLIARDQVAKFNGQLSRLRQQEIGVTEYIWRSALDERTRDAHRIMEGRICSWDDPSIYKNEPYEEWKNRSSISGLMLHPGQDYQCRCYPEAVFIGILDNF